VQILPFGHTAGTTVLCVSLLVLARRGLSRMACGSWVVLRRARSSPSCPAPYPRRQLEALPASGSR